MSSLNVLYITYDGLTDPLGQSQVLPYLVGLSRQGYSFTILSFEKKERMAREGAQVRAVTQAAGINWVPLSFTPKPPVLAKIYDRRRMWRTAKRLHKAKGFALTHCRSYVSAEPALKLKQRFGVKMLFDMRGFWADEKIDSGQWNPSNPLYKILYRYYKQKERAFFLQSDATVSLTYAAKDYLLQQPQYRHLDVVVIPCCADLRHFNYETVTTAQKAAARKKLGLPEGAKVVTYAGSYGGWYMTREMFAFVKLLLEKDPSFVFLFLTKDDAEKVRAEAVEIGLAAEKLFVVSASRNEMPVFLSLSHLSVFFIRNTFSKIASSPTKHAEIMGMGIPVVCNTIGDTGHIITETKTGVLVDRFDTDSLREGVAQLPQLAAIDKAYIRSCAAHYFDLEIGVQRYLSIYQKLIPLRATPVVS